MDLQIITPAMREAIKLMMSEFMDDKLNAFQ